MALRTAIIDIGSNSARLVIFERTSRYGFHLICEQKSKVRIGEGAYAKDGYLQPSGIERAYLALDSFIQTTKKYHVKKTLCVATSALRDAPNGRDFVCWIRRELKLSIRIIDGDEEARLGAIATSNLLPITDGITIDIGGGSSDISRISQGSIVETCSLNIGTVRIKELFFDKGLPLKEARAFVKKELDRLPDSFKHPQAIGIGGTARALSKGIMKSSGYPLDKIHAFEYDLEEYMPYLSAITEAKIGELGEFRLKKERHDTIREGTLILVEIIKKIDARRVITSGVGVREGVFLKDLLRHSNLSFPHPLDPSTRSILDRFDNLTAKDSRATHRVKVASDLYTLFHENFNLGYKHIQSLNTALKLYNIGKTLTIYKSYQHAFYIAMHELNYGFTHREMILISLLLRMEGDNLLNKALVETYKELLPKKSILRSLSFIYSITTLLHENANSASFTFSYTNKVLTIHANQSLYHAKESIDSLEKPHDFKVVIDDLSVVPKYNF